VTGDEVRALCLSLPEATEKETWGDESNPGHPTFRVKDKIFVIMAVDESGGSVKTSMEEQTALMASFPEGARYASHTGRYGWVELDFASIPDEVLTETIEGAWTRTAPKKLAAELRASR
jgi:predicted DNA-binding protein (MmcQ/YjbR family)